MFVWMLVTLITDSSAVFYRKHEIYKRRMEAELANVKRSGAAQNTTESFTEYTSDKISSK